MAEAWEGGEGGGYGEEEEGGGVGQDEFEGQSPDYTNKDALLILLDCHRDMFELPSVRASRDLKKEKEENAAEEAAPAGEKSFFEISMEVVAGLCKDRIIKNSSDSIGICFFSSAQQKNDNSFPGVYVLSAVQQPDAKLIRRLGVLSDPDTFAKEIGTGDDSSCEFHHALWVSSQLLNVPSLRKNTFRRVFLITCRDDPTSARADQKERALRRAQDLDDLGAEMLLIPLRQVSLEPLYGQMMVTNDDEDTGNLVVRWSSRISELSNLVRKKEHKKRSLATVALELAPGLSIGVSLYVLLHRTTKGAAIKVHQVTHERLESTTRQVCRETGAVLEPHQIRLCRPYGDVRVYFEPDEIKDLADFGPAGLVLMGFKDADDLKIYHQVRTPYFLYPNESLFVGSTVAFHALLEQMAHMRKIAVCRLIYRRKSAPRLVALLPQLERRDNKSGEQIDPPGMHLVFLPYADDLRAPKIDESPDVPDALVDAAKQLVGSATIKPPQVQNPSLQRHYAVLQALALDEEVPNDVSDQLRTVPKLALKVAGPIQALNELVADVAGPAAASASASSGARPGAKRARAGAGAGADADADGAPPPAAKRGRKAAGAGAASADGEPDVQALAASGQLSSLTVDALKQALRGRGAPVSGRKDDLVERLAALLQ